MSFGHKKNLNVILKLLLVFTVFFYFTPQSLFSQSYYFTKSIGGINDDYILDDVIDDAGIIYLVDQYKETVDFGTSDVKTFHNGALFLAMWI